MKLGGSEQGKLKEWAKDAWWSKVSKKGHLYDDSQSFHAGLQNMYNYYSYTCAHQTVTAAHSCVCDIKSTKARHIDTGSKIMEQNLFTNVTTFLLCTGTSLEWKSIHT